MRDIPDKCDLAPPQELILYARSVLGSIDLDPYSTPLINRLVVAAHIYDRDKEHIDDVIARPWYATGDKRVFVGPPVGAAATRRLINKALREYRAGRINEAILWIGHNEALIRAPWIWDFPVCIPFRRLRPCYYDDDLDRFRPISPSDWSAIVYLPPPTSSVDFHAHLSRFHVAFSAMGRVVFNEYSGEDDWVHAYQAVMKKPYDYRA
jgi:hypothetical protein